jgi:hypothetical protein
LQQRSDLLGRVEIDGRTTGDLQLAPADARRVARDQVVLDGELENLSQPRERLVDRLGRDDALLDLGLPVAVDLFDRDLGQPVAGEEGQQVMGQLPTVDRDRARPQLVLAARKPLRGELVEGRVARRLRRRRGHRGLAHDSD